MTDASDNGKAEEVVYISSKFRSMLEAYLIDAAKSMNRCSDLLDLFDTLESTQAGSSQDQRDDLLRAIVVLTHACMEDCLRTVARYALPDSSREALDDVPFYLEGRPVPKVSLGYLAEHKDLTIGDFVARSVDMHMDRVSFSSTSEVVGLLRRLWISLDHDGLLSSLGEMIQRRHEIVHRADVCKASRSPAKLDPKKVREWFGAVGGLVIAVAAGLVERDGKHNKLRRADA